MEGPDGIGVAMYLHRRGAHWWLRKAVPSDLTGVLGRPDLRRFLRTRNAVLARRRALQVLIRIDEVYAVLRSQCPMRRRAKSPSPCSTMLSDPSPARHRS